MIRLVRHFENYEFGLFKPDLAKSKKKRKIESFTWQIK